MLLHLRPGNVITQVVGGAMLVYGIWFHFATIILIATSLILAGHLWGWRKVHDAF